MKEKRSQLLIGIIMGSDSDLPIMREAAIVLEELGIPFEITIVSAHRTPNRLYEYATNAAKRGLKVIIAGAGGSAHLPGMAAALTVLPVVGVPVHTKALNGVDSLYSIVQMPPGIPVATMAINGAKNAGLFAARVIATTDVKLQQKLAEYAKEVEAAVLAKASKLEVVGYKHYKPESA
jgi:5-(carboxyamino)imidazole ribonucleotide mutase